jgi:hypothetical protein
VRDDLVMHKCGRVLGMPTYTWCFTALRYMGESLDLFFCHWIRAGMTLRLRVQQIAISCFEIFVCKGLGDLRSRSQCNLSYIDILIANGIKLTTCS